MFYRPHRRQFVIAPKQVELPNWRSSSFGAGLVLSHDRELEVQSVGGTTTLGTALLGGEFGRYVRVHDGRLELDASGLLAVYYGEGDDGPFATSSPALAHQFRGGDRASRVLRWAPGSMNWHPTPGSATGGVRRLCRDQALVLASGQVERSERSFEPPDDVAVAVDLLAHHIGEAAAALPDRSIMLALTAGLDSRLLLAGLLASGRRFGVVTQMITGGLSAEVDVRVAGRLATRYGLDHTVARAGRHDPTLESAMRLHTFAAYADADHVVLPRGQYDFFDSETLLVRGGCFELGRRHYHEFLGELSGGADDVARIAAAFGLESPDDDPAIGALAEWHAWRCEFPGRLDLRDAFYLDQRIGGWLSSVEQNLDALPGLSIHPANSETAFRALLGSTDPEALRSGLIQRRAAERLVPGILEIPINPRAAQPLWHRSIRAARSRIRRLVARTPGSRLG